MNDDMFRELLDGLGYSWKGYRKVRKGVRRRVRRHMQELDSPTVRVYLRELERNPLERLRCEQLLGVSISRFFRDRKLWEVMEKDILPSLVRRAGESLTVWSAGCACGEELYSFKILWHECARSVARVPGLRALATDLNPLCVKRAREGVYPLSSLKEVDQELRSRYFISRDQGKSYAVSDFLKDGNTWEAGDLCSKSAESLFSVIFLRNSVLTYYGEVGRMVALQGVLQCLAPDGILIIGSHEKLPPVTSGLVGHGVLPYVFQKASGRRRRRTGGGLNRANDRYGTSA